MATSKNKIVEAIKLIKADAQFSVIEEDIDQIEWLNGETPIAKEDIEAKLTEAENLIDAEANAKVTGKAKLKSGEALTDAEISALFGD